MNRVKQYQNTDNSRKDLNANKRATTPSRFMTTKKSNSSFTNGEYDLIYRNESQSSRSLLSSAKKMQILSARPIASVLQQTKPKTLMRPSSASRSRPSSPNSTNFEMQSPGQKIKLESVQTELNKVLHDFHELQQQYNTDKVSWKCLEEKLNSEVRDQSLAKIKLIARLISQHHENTIDIGDMSLHDSDLFSLVDMISSDHNSSFQASDVLSIVMSGNKLSLIEPEVVSNLIKALLSCGYDPIRICIDLSSNLISVVNSSLIDVMTREMSTNESGDKSLTLRFELNDEVYEKQVGSCMAITDTRRGRLERIEFKVNNQIVNRNTSSKLQSSQSKSVVSYSPAAVKFNSTMTSSTNSIYNTQTRRKKKKSYEEMPPLPGMMLRPSPLLSPINNNNTSRKSLF